jgi:hypothetical protein
MPRRHSEIGFLQPFGRPRIVTLVWYHDTVHRLFQDDLLAAPSISWVRASGLVTMDMTSVIVTFGESDHSLPRVTRLQRCRVSSTLGYRLIYTHDKQNNNYNGSFRLQQWMYGPLAASKKRGLWVL